MLNETMADASAQLAQYAEMVPGGQVAVSLISFVLMAVIFYSIAMMVFKTAKHLTRKTQTTLDDHLIKHLRRPMKWISVILAAYLSLQMFYPGFDIFGNGIDTIFKILFLIIGTYTVNNIFSAFMGWYGQEMAPKTESKFDDEIFPLFKKIGSILIYIIGMTVVLNQLGVEVSALIAALGIGGLAIALALQDTLGNFFAGVHLLADRPVRPGDYIQVEGSSIIGTIEEVGWRSTRVKTWDNNLIYIPNSKMSSSVIINYFNPGHDVACVVPYTASYEDDPDRVIETLWEALRATEKKIGRVMNVEKSIVRAQAFLDSAIEYKVIIQIPDYRERFAVQAELNRQVYYLFKKKGITIPYPTRTLYLQDEKGGSVEKKTVKMKKGGKKAA